MGVRRPFWLALAVSLLIHLAVALSPGWPLPSESDAPALAATLMLPPRPAASAEKAPVAPRPRPAAPKAPAESPPPAPPPLAQDVPVGPAEGNPPGIEAVPPAPTFAPPQQALAEAAAAPAPLTGRLPPAGRIVYQVLRGGDGFVIGQSEQRWQHDGEHYRLSAETGTTGLAALFKPVKVVLKSRGVFDPQGLRPLEFERWQGERLREQIRFEPEAGKVWLAGQSVEFVPGVQDLLSIFYQLGVLTAATPRFGVAVAAGRKVATYAVTVGAVALLDLPQGARAARAYTIEAGSERTEVWLDADTQLPIKIRHQDKKGELFEQLATLIELE